VKNTPHDWDYQKNQFVQSTLSFRAFCRNNKINYSVAYPHYRKEKWLSTRNRFRIKVNAKVENKAVKDYAKTWTRLENTWELLLEHAEASLKRNYVIDGKTKKERLDPVGVESQAKVANVLDHVTKNLRLLAGESTENVESQNPEIEGLKNDLSGLNRAIASEMAEIEKLQKSIKTKTGK